MHKEGAAMPVKKVDLQGLIDDLLNEIRGIDGDSEMSRGRKTQAIERAASKFKNRLHDSKRKAEKNRISLSTYNRYLTMARREITKQDWKHHTLQEQIERLAKRYPSYADRLFGWLDMGIEEMRFAHRDFLKEILLQDRSGVGDNNALYQDIRSMKLDHEVMLHLTKNAVQATSFREEQGMALEEKKSSNARVRLNYKRYIGLLLDLLTRPTVTVDDYKAFAFSRLALGLAGATGRRMIEVVYQGDFRKISKHQLEFVGQAKKRGGSDPGESNVIYTLVDADLVVAALTELRRLPEVTALSEFDHLDEVDRNTQINRRIAKTCNMAAKRELAPICDVEVLPGDTPADIEEKQNRLFKDTRTIYARIAYDLFYKSDARWKGKDEDVFWRDILGHEGLKALQNYKQFEVDYSEPVIDESADADVLPEGSRLAKLAAIDADVAERKAFTKLHDYAKERITEDPQTIITKSQLIRFVGAGRKVIEDYLAVAGDALSTPEMADVTGIAFKPKTPKRQNATTPKPEGLAPADILELVRTSNEKPRVQAAEDGPDGWAGVVLLAGVEVVRVTAHTSQMDALRAAYAAYEALLKTAEQQA